MCRSRKSSLLLCLLFLAVAMLIFPLDSWSGVPTMTKDELKAHMSVPNFVIIDVRTASNWKESDVKIKGAVREEPDKVKDWASKYQKEKVIVLYCA